MSDKVISISVSFLGSKLLELCVFHVMFVMCLNYVKLDGGLCE